MLVPPRLLFSGLIDDAAVFPPRNARIASAVAGHLTWRNTSNRDLIGPLLCPATRVEELSAALPVDEHVHLTIVLDGETERLTEALTAIGEDRRLILVGVEAAHARLRDAAYDVGATVARLRGVTGSLEVDAADFDGSLCLIAPGCWHNAKYRTGGATPDAFPTEAELASFLVTCVTRGLQFKLTAGLHHAMRNYDPRTGFQQHGVLNVLLATDAALADQPFDTVAALLAQRNPDVVTARLKQWDAERCAGVRQSFRSFGCCEPAEPIAEIKALGLLQEWPA